MTGADSPVIADSSTEAMPSMISPSLGIKSPAATRTMSPILSCAAGVGAREGHPRPPARGSPDRTATGIWLAPPSQGLRSEQGPGLHRELLDQRAERDGREIGEAADDRDDANQQADKQTAIGRKGAGRGRRYLLRGERSGDRQHRNDHEEAADQHRQADRRVVEKR